MSYEVIQPVGKYQYIYLAESYRTPDGKTHQRRRIIGKIDPETGKKRYKPEYLEELERRDAAGLERFSSEELLRSQLKECGIYFLFQKLADRTGLTDQVREAFPETWQALFQLACFSVAFGDLMRESLALFEDTDPEEMDEDTLSELSNRIAERIRTQREQALKVLQKRQDYLEKPASEEAEKPHSL